MVLEDQITIGGGREYPREIPAKPAPAVLMHAFVARPSALTEDVRPEAPCAFRDPKSNHAPASPMFCAASRCS
jgi:hypothetical protein